VEIDVRGIRLASLITRGSLVDLGLEPGAVVHCSFEAAVVHSF